MSPRKTTPTTNRLAFDMSSVTIVDSVPAEQVPVGTHPHPGGKRRWQELVEAIRESSRNGEYLLVSVAAGHSAETVRQGVSAELKRFGLRVRVRSVPAENGVAMLYFTAVGNDPVA